MNNLGDVEWFNMIFFAFHMEKENTSNFWEIMNTGTWGEWNRHGHGLLVLYPCYMYVWICSRQYATNKSA